MTFTLSSLLFWPDDSAAGFAAALAGAGAGSDVAMATGFSAGAGEPGAGFALCAPAAAISTVALSLCFGCSEFWVLRVLSMAFGFCAQAPPAIIAIVRMPVVSFIAIPYLAAGVAGFAGPAAGCAS